jgi:hypothetical protein
MIISHIFLEQGQSAQVLEKERFRLLACRRGINPYAGSACHARITAVQTH